MFAIFKLNIELQNLSFFVSFCPRNFSNLNIVTKILTENRNSFVLFTKKDRKPLFS